MRPKKCREAGRVIGTAQAVAELLARDARTLEQECFWTIAVNVRNELIGYELIALGTAYSVEVHPRDVYRFAVRSNAAGIVVAHNHPSGDPLPSPEDVVLTRRLFDAGQILGIPMVDHVVITSKPAMHRSIAEQYPNLWRS
jgi:DNA repair protein RadC